MEATLRRAGCVFAADEARLLARAATSPERLEQLVARRVSGEPLEQVLGWADFHGRRVLMDPGVFVPRRRTELLVTVAVEAARRGLEARDDSHPLVVVDLCCGSGAVGACIEAALPRVELHCVDVDPIAARCASRNVSADAVVHVGDLYAPLPRSLRGRVDLVVANAPYVPTAELPLMPPEARLHEARVALDGGADGTAVQRRVISGAGSWLAPTGHLLVETSEQQEGLTAGAFVRHGLVTRVERDAGLGATVVAGSPAGVSPPRAR